MHHLIVKRDDDLRTLMMVRDEARILINFGQECFKVPLLEGEQIALTSRSGLSVHGNRLELPSMTLAVLLSMPEDAEDRQVSARQRKV